MNMNQQNVQLFSKIEKKKWKLVIKTKKLLIKYKTVADIDLQLI